MPMHSTDIDRIAKLLAKHLPDFEQRQRLASKAEVASTAQIAGDVLEAWRDIVHCAQSAGHLEILLESALVEKPGEREIERVLQGLRGVPAPKTSRYVGVAVAILLGGALAYGLSDREEPLDRESETISAAEQTHLENVRSVVEPEVVDEGSIVTEDSVQLEVLEEEPVATEVTSIENLQAAERDADVSHALGGRCGGPEGSRVGYFYANDGIAAVPGETYTMEGDVNVRADYPNKSNQWSVSSPISCVLVKGDQIVLTEPVFEVDGGKYWVPLFAGDLQQGP